MAEAAWTTGVLIVFLVTGAGRSLTVRVESLATSSGVPPAVVPPVVAASFALALLILVQVGLLPLAFRRDYALDRRYGLTTARPRVWLADYVKGQSAAGVLVVGAAAVVAACLRQWPDRWWVPAWGGAVMTSLAVAWAMPAWILPRFSRVAPLDRKDLESRLATLAKVAGRPAVGIYTRFLSTHTRRVNALMLGIGARRRILLSDTLLGDCSDDEIVVIVAHELAHDVHHDIWKGMAAHAAVVGLGLWFGHLALTRMVGPLGLRDAADPGGLPLLALVVGATSTLLAPATHALSRRLERQADRFALNLTRDPDAFVRAVKRISAGNLADEDPPALTRLLFYRHPPVSQRIAGATRWKLRYLPDTTSSPRMSRQASSVLRSQ